MAVPGILWLGWVSCGFGAGSSGTGVSWFSVALVFLYWFQISWVYFQFQNRFLHHHYFLQFGIILSIFKSCRSVQTKGFSNTLCHYDSSGLFSWHSCLAKSAGLFTNTLWCFFWGVTWSLQANQEVLQLLSRSVVLPPDSLIFVHRASCYIFIGVNSAGQKPKGYKGKQVIKSCCLMKINPHLHSCFTTFRVYLSLYLHHCESRSPAGFQSNYRNTRSQNNWRFVRTGWGLLFRPKWDVGSFLPLALWLCLPIHIKRRVQPLQNRHLLLNYVYPRKSISFKYLPSKWPWTVSSFCNFQLLSSAFPVVKVTFRRV